MNELDELLSHSFEDIKGSKLILELLRLSREYLGVQVTDCEKQHRSYYEKLKTIKNKPMAQQTDYLNKKYILKPGKVLYYNHTHFNNDTLTDKIAGNAIKKFPNLAGAFISDRERAVLEAKVKAKSNITNAEDAVNDEQFENKIIALIDAEKFDEAREVTARLLDEETRVASLEAIDEGEENLKAAAEVAEKAKTEAAAAEEKRIADEKATADKLKKAAAEKVKKAAADKKHKEAAKKAAAEKKRKEAAEKAESEKNRKNEAITED